MVKKTYLEDPSIACRDIAKLDPKLVTILSTFLSTLETLGVHMMILETYRTQSRQEYLIKRGASRIKHSLHMDGKAVDILPVDKSGKLLWDYPFKSWQLIGELGKKLGLTWGGDWPKFRDMVHFQLD